MDTPERKAAQVQARPFCSPCLARESEHRYGWLGHIDHATTNSVKALKPEASKRSRQGLDLLGVRVSRTLLQADGNGCVCASSQKFDFSTAQKSVPRNIGVRCAQHRNRPPPISRRYFFE